MGPGNDRALAVGAAQGSEDHETTDSSSIVGHHAEDGKPLATVQAEAALLGVRVERLRGRGCWSYVVMRQGRAIDCCDLEAVRQAVHRLGGAT